MSGLTGTGATAGEGAGLEGGTKRKGGGDERAHGFLGGESVGLGVMGGSMGVSGGGGSGCDGSGCGGSTGTKASGGGGNNNPTGD